MTTAVIYDRDGNPLEDDIVPDGGYLRVPIPFMDALSEATQRAFVRSDGAPPARDNAAPLVRDAAPPARDAAALPPLYDGLGNPVGGKTGHRAGFVYGPAELQRDAVAAYAEFKAQLSDAWRQPAALRPRSAPRHDEDDNDGGTGGDSRATHDAAAAYAEYCARVANAWRSAR
jgi:hypothetical protein